MRKRKHFYNDQSQDLLLNSLRVRSFTPMSLRRNQKEVLKLHALRRRALRQPNTPVLSKEESNRISQLHASKMNTDA